ncbi:MAG: FxLYD domain-containing protein, partial [Phenylobacterium sp.]
MIAVGVALFRNPIVRLWPKTAALYAAAGVSVNGVGLVIEQVRVSPAVQNGQAILGVSGRIRNERDKPTPAAPLQVTLLDARGAILKTLVAKPVDTLPPLQSRYFQVLVRNPPPG